MQLSSSSLRTLSSTYILSLLALLTLPSLSYASAFSGTWTGTWTSKIPTINATTIECSCSVNMQINNKNKATMIFSNPTANPANALQTCKILTDTQCNGQSFTNDIQLYSDTNEFTVSISASHSIEDQYVYPFDLKGQQLTSTHISQGNQYTIELNKK